MRAGHKEARWLREGDRVTFPDGSHGTVDELPYLAASGLVRARVLTPSGRQRLATAWNPSDVVAVESESNQGWIEEGA